MIQYSFFSIGRYLLKGTLLYDSLIRFSIGRYLLKGALLYDSNSVSILAGIC